MPTDHGPVILTIFALTYVGLAIGRIPGLKLNRTGMALLGAIGMMIFSGRSAGETASSVSWPTILLLFGFFVISAQLQLSGFYGRVASAIAERLGAPKRFLLYLIVVTAALSAFLNHDVVCYVLTPVVAAALIRRQINPVPFLIALAAASNIGAAATLVGNPQNMTIGTIAGLSFLKYMLWSVVPVLFGLVCIYVVARIERRGGPPKLCPEDVEPVGPAYPLDRYHTLKGLVVLAAVIALFFTPVPREITVLVAAGIHLLSTKYRTEDLLGLVDWSVLLIFTSLFVVSGAFEATGYGERLVRWMVGVGFDPSNNTNGALLTTGLSALIGNAPAVMVLIKIMPIAHISSAYMLAVANSFAGNVVMTASLSNIIVIQQARRQGIAISFGDFFRIGLPITVASLGALIGWAVLMGA